MTAVFLSLTNISERVLRLLDDGTCLGGSLAGQNGTCNSTDDADTDKNFGALLLEPKALTLMKIRFAGSS